MFKHLKQIAFKVFLQPRCVDEKKRNTLFLTTYRRIDHPMGGILRITKLLTDVHSKQRLL